MSRRRADRISGTSALLGATALACVGACNHAWDTLEPLSSASSSAGSGGSGATTGSSSGAASTTASSASSSAGSGGHGGAGTGGGTGSGGGTGTGGGTGSGGGAVSSSSSGGAGGAGPVSCGHTNLLSWDFSSDQPQVFDRDDPETDVSGGKGTIQLPANSGDSAVFRSIRTYDLRGDRVFIEVTQIPNQAQGTYGGLELDYDNGDDLFIGVYANKLECGFDHNNNESLPGQAPYDPVAHRWWQLREDQGTIHCETSPDGVTWSDAGSFDIVQSQLATPSALRVQLIAATPDNMSMPGALEVDNLNGGGAPTGSWCKASSTSDDFADMPNLPGPAWDRGYSNDSGDSYDQTGDRLNFHWGSSDSSDLAYGSSVAYDMTGERVTLQLVHVPGASPPPGDTYFSVSNDDNNDVYWVANSDGFKCGYDSDANGSNTIWQGQAPPLPAWLGLRESGGKVYCEILVNGTWKVYGSIGGIVDTTRADVFMGAYAYSGSQSGSYLTTFDGYNLAPVP